MCCRWEWSNFTTNGREITECSLKISDSYVAKHPKNYKPEIVSDVLREYLAKLTRFFGGPNAKPLCSQLYSKKLLSATVYQMVLESPMYINQALLESAAIIAGNAARFDDFLGILEEDAFAPIAEEIRNGEARRSQCYNFIIITWHVHTIHC